MCQMRSPWVSIAKKHGALSDIVSEPRLVRLEMCLSAVLQTSENESAGPIENNRIAKENDSVPLQVQTGATG